MPSPKGSNPENYSSILRQATAQGSSGAAVETPQTGPATASGPTAFQSSPLTAGYAPAQKTGANSVREETSVEITGAKTMPFKLPQMHAGERAETDPNAAANENNTLLLMQSWQRGKQYVAQSSKQHLPSIIMFCGATLSAMWLAAAVVYVHNAVGWQNIKTLMPHEIGGFLAGLLTPVALFWMMLTFWLRSVDVKLYAETLREEIQSMIFPSEEAERRVNNDIDRLMKQTAEMSRATRMALGTLQQARQAMHSETQAMQNGAQQTADRLEGLEQRLSSRQKNLTELHIQFEEKGLLLEKASAQLLKDATQLNQVVGETSVKTDAIGKTLQGPLQQLQGWQTDIVDALNSGLVQINDKQTLLRLDAKAIEDRAMRMAEVLQHSTDKLYDFSDEALDKAKLIETRLQGQSISLQDTLQQIAAQTQSLTAQRDALMQSLQNSTEEGRDKLVDHVAMLESTTIQLQDTQTKVAHHMKALLQNAGQNWTNQAEIFNQSIETSAARTVDILGQAQSSLKTGYDGLQSDVENATRKINMMMQHIQVDLSDVATTIQTTISQQHRQTKDFVDSLVRDNQDKTAAAATSLVQLQKELAELASQLANRGQALGETGEQNAQTLRSLYIALEDGMKQINDTTGRLKDSVDYARTSLEQPLDQLETAAQNAQDNAQMIGNMLDQRISGLNSLSVALTNQASAAGVELDAKSQSLTKILSRLQSSVTLLNADIEIQSGLLDNKVSASLDKAAAIVPELVTIQQTFNAVNEHSDKAQASLIRLNDAALSGSQHLVSISDATMSRVQKTLDSYKDIHQGYQAINDMSVAHYDTLHERHNVTLKQLENSTQAANNMAVTHYDTLQKRHEATLKQLANSTAQVMDDADKVSLHYQKLNDVLHALQQEAGNSQTVATQTAVTLKQTQGTLAQTAENVRHYTGQSIEHIGKLQAVLQVTGETSVGHIEKLALALDQAESQSGILLVQTERLADATHKHTNTIQGTVNSLQQAALQTDTAYEAVAAFDTRLTAINDKLTLQQTIMQQQGDTIEALIASALDKLRDQTDTLAQTTDTLVVATDTARSQVDTIRQQDQQLQRDHFFNATKFIVESLHSLALDFTRMLDGELPEKTWKAYQKGDTSVFAKRLVSLRDDTSNEKIRAKFKDDVEFRTYVQRYIRQFEEIHTNAKQQDYGDLLSGVFTSSDIGRLYAMLKNVVSE